MVVKKGERSSFLRNFVHHPSTFFHWGKVKEVKQEKSINIGIFSLFIYFFPYITLPPAQYVYMAVCTHAWGGERTKRERREKNGSSRARGSPDGTGTSHIIRHTFFQRCRFF